ncbi:MAG: inositol monophosphatase [Verrucomicrobia bacterium]|nr:MAG: inositol monophosphatase [Verrucomicrobiota bacterium]
MNTDLEKRIAMGRSAIAAQTELLHRSFGKVDSQWKHDGTRVTSVDLEISRRIFDTLGGEFPNDQLFSEESDHGPSKVTARFAWILDPVDGTNNYALGIPMVAISLALLEDGEPIYGFVYDLGTRCTTHGGPGSGLWVDDEPVKKREPDEWKETVIAMHSSIKTRHKPVVEAVRRKGIIRAFGSGALHLTHVALGRMDACLDFTIKVWDIAAAVALCRESGIEIHYLEESPFPLREFDVRMKSIAYLAARPEILEELKGCVPDT